MSGFGATGAIFLGRFSKREGRHALGAASDRQREREIVIRVDNAAVKPMTHSTVPISACALFCAAFKGYDAMKNEVSPFFFGK
jgi:hypothetical protein